MQRVLTAVPLALLSLYLIWWAPAVVFFIAAFAVGVICYWEYSGLLAQQGIPRSLIVGLLGGCLILFSGSLPHRMLLPLLFCLLIGTFASVLWLHDIKLVLTSAACAFAGMLYVFVPWRIAVDLRPISANLVFFSLALNWAGDTIAYYVGRAIGKHRLAPLISPNKTWEGSIGSVFGSVIFAILYGMRFLPQLSVGALAILAIAGNIAGQFGDLVESAIKRGAGVKDSGSILPGHGGLLDRLDSTLFSIPVVYALYLALMPLIGK
jgi:phosphatidate cytidylyltransferase